MKDLKSYKAFHYMPYCVWLCIWQVTFEFEWLNVIQHFLFCKFFPNLQDYPQSSALHQMKDKTHVSSMSLVMHYHHADRKQTWWVYERWIKSLYFLCITYVNTNGGIQALNYPLHCPCMKSFICIFNHDIRGIALGLWFSL